MQEWRRIPLWKKICAGVAVCLALYAVLAIAQPTTTTTIFHDFTNGLRATSVVVTPAATQTIAAGGIITADSCGGVKRITAAGAVTTDTTNSITAPTAALANCSMMICNVGATNAITIDKNANILLFTGANVALAGNSCLAVSSDGVIWRQTTAQLTAT